MFERRSQSRLLDSELVMLTWEQGAINLKQLGNVDNLSADGIGVRVDHPVPVGTPVTISYGSSEDAMLTGIIKQHSSHPGGHLLGIEFIQGSKESALHFHPELLIRPM